MAEPKPRLARGFQRVKKVFSTRSKPPGLLPGVLDVAQQQPQLLSQLFPKLPQPQQKISTRMMIHHQLLPPNPQMPLELQFIR